MNKLMALLLGTVVLASSGAFAADSHQCAKGKHWNATAKHCVATPKKQ